MSKKSKKKDNQVKNFEELRGQKHPIKSKRMIEAQEALIKSKKISKVQSEIKLGSEVIGVRIGSLGMSKTQDLLNIQPDSKKAKKTEKKE